MKWVTTNIRFPEDMYLELKHEAARHRKSLAAVVRERVTQKTAKDSHQKEKNVEKFMKKLDKLAKENDKQNPGISFSEKLIEMRYEQ